MKSESDFLWKSGKMSLLDIESDTYKCIIKNKASGREIQRIVVEANDRYSIVCEFDFHKSDNDKYVPRLKFRKCLANNHEQTAKKKGNDIIINFQEDGLHKPFWEIISWLSSFKELIDQGRFRDHFVAVPRDRSRVEEFLHYLNLDGTRPDQRQQNEVIQAIRMPALKDFYDLLKNPMTGSLEFREKYRSDNGIARPGEEVLWQHLLESHKWILGLGADIRFIRDFLGQQSVGKIDSRRKGSPISDLVGLSYFSTLIELKTSEVEIFAKNREGAARTWNFTSDFYEGINQCLGQKDAFSNDDVDLIDKGKVVDSEEARTLDPRCLLIIGNRLRQFPHDRGVDNNTKSDTFERFRRNSRNVDVVTYDELFERAYYIVTDKRLNSEWWKANGFDDLQSFAC